MWSFFFLFFLTSYPIRSKCVHWFILLQWTNSHPDNLLYNQPTQKILTTLIECSFLRCTCANHIKHRDLDISLACTSLSYVRRSLFSLSKAEVGCALVNKDKCVKPIARCSVVSTMQQIKVLQNTSWIQHGHVGSYQSLTSETTATMTGNWHWLTYESSNMQNKKYWV